MRRRRQGDKDMAGRLRGRLPAMLGGSYVTTSWGQGRAEDRSNRDEIAKRT
jgi:hypothetical protein